MFAVLVILPLLSSLTLADYWSDRRNFLKLEASEEMGASIRLTPQEEVANKILMNYKLKEYDGGFRTPQTFLPAMHFFKSKPLIEQSDVFKIIQKFPKGASLHSHDLALASFEYLYNTTFRDNLYVGCIRNDSLKFKFFTPQQAARDTTCRWDLVSKLRAAVKGFDDFIKSQLTIIVKDPLIEYRNINAVWTKFQATFQVVIDIISYKPVFHDYFYQVLKELLEDNVMHLEFRGILHPVYDLEGRIYGPEEVVQMYIDTLNQFKRDHPLEFFDVKFIYAPYRGVDNATIEDYVNLALDLKKKFPDFIAGFDLVGQEDHGRPLDEFIEPLLQLAQHKVKFFFHAGETNWNGAATDMNLVDAVLLNTSRIGHGFGVTKHPKVLETIKKNGIAIEISPISNQVLKLVDDLRNHPAVFLVAHDYPVVITCDDPGFWGAKALSYDWYLAFMGFGSREADLRLLKQFAINSIVYSAMNKTEKVSAAIQWRRKWAHFINLLVPLAPAPNVYYV